MFFRRKKNPRGPQRHKQSLTIPENSDAWPAIEELLDENTERVYRLKVDEERAYTIYNQLGVSKESHMGAIVLNTGGVLVDGGWIRILGSGDDEAPGMGSWTPTENGRPKYMTIAVDVLGGIFAIDGGALGVSLGYVCYFDPARLEWGPLAPDYAGFLNWIFSKSSDQLYDQWKWEDWQKATRGLGMTEGLRLDPPVHAQEFDRNSLEVEACDLEELWQIKFIAGNLQVPPPQG